MRALRHRPVVPAIALVAAACANSPREVSPGAAPASPAPSIAAAAPTSSAPLAVVEGLTGPEAVRYDAEQDVYFVSNFGSGQNSQLDNNGFISRVRPDGAVDQLRFVAGGENGVTLHAPRGMTTSGDTLWVADADALRGFDRRTGAPLATVSFAGQDVGFLNDVARGADGTLYLTDTGRNRVYRIAAGAATVAAADSALGSPNGITWDASGNRFIVVPYGGARAIRAWHPERGAALEDVGTSAAGGRYDGVEVLSNGQVLVASQTDSSLHLFAGGTSRPIIRVAGRPADIAVDTRRNRVAVPFIALNRVEIWQLP